MHKHILWLIVILLPNSAQAPEELQLQIRLRHSDGTAVFGETVILEQLPEEEPVLWQANNYACTTSNSGECSWLVTSGLYQVLFTRSLDDLSALAVAEGGLSGFGLTVGDEDIAYHFTFHSDGQVYFDAAPNADVPSPIIPEPDDIHDWQAPTPSSTAESTPPVESTTVSSVGVTTTQGTVTDRPWRPLIFVLLGVGLGVGLYLLRPRLGRIWSRKQRKTADKRPAHSPSEEKDA